MNIATVQFFSDLQHKLPKSIIFSLKNDFLNNKE